MKKEIGGYFEIENQTKTDNEHYPNLIVLNTGIDVWII